MSVHDLPRKSGERPPSCVPSIHADSMPHAAVSGTLAPSLRPLATRGMRVWVVGDDPIACVYLADLLASHGHEVVTYSNARQALHAFLCNPGGVDTVIADERMPSRCGEALARVMLGLRPQLRIILCTGQEDAQSAARAFELGIRHVFHKPFDSRALLGALRRDAPGG